MYKKTYSFLKLFKIIFIYNIIYALMIFSFPFLCVYKNLNLNKLLNKHLIMIINIDNKKRFLFIITYVSWKFIILENLFIIFLIPHFLLNIYNYWLKIKIINYNPKMYNQMTKFNLYFSSIFISSSNFIVQ